MTITFTSGSREGERISFGLKNAILMGRSHSAQIRLFEFDVSGRHAEIMPSDGGVQIICHSRQGLRVNGNIVSMDERRSLSVGDEIAIGRQVRFTVDDISDTVDETVITFTAEPKGSSGNKYNESRINSVDGNDDMTGDDAKTIDVKEMEAWRRYSQAYEKMYTAPAER